MIQGRQIRGAVADWEFCIGEIHGERERQLYPFSNLRPRDSLTRTN